MNAHPTRHIKTTIETRYLVALTPVFASILLLVDVSTSEVVATLLSCTRRPCVPVGIDCDV